MIPFFTFAIFVLTLFACSMLCVTQSTVRCLFFEKFIIVFSIVCIFFGSTPSDGSSSNNTSGLMVRALEKPDNVELKVSNNYGMYHESMVDYT